MSLKLCRMHAGGLLSREPDIFLKHARIGISEIDEGISYTRPPNKTRLLSATLTFVEVTRNC